MKIIFALDIRKKVALGLIVLSFVFWVISLSQMRLLIGHFGLLESLVPTFYIAFGCLLASVLLLWPWKHCFLLLFLQSLLLVMFLWLTPPLIGGSQPVVAHVYSFWGNVDYILSNGHLSVHDVWYHVWPGSWILYVTLALSTGLSAPSFIITYMPFFWEVLNLPLLYLLMSKLSSGTGSQYYWAGIWLFFLGNWVGQNYLSPQSFAYFTYLLLISLFILRIDKITNNKQFDIQILLIILFSSLVVTHIVTTLVFLAIAFLFCFGKRYRRSILFGFITFFFIWNIYSVLTAFPAWGTQLISNAFNIDALFNTSLATRFVGSSSRLDVLTVRTATTVLIVLMGLFGFFISFFKRKVIRRTHLSVVKIFLAVTILTLVLGMGGGFEVPYRIYLFILPFFAFFTCTLLTNKFTGIALVIFLVALLPLSIISQYGNQMIDYQSPMDVAALNFFHDITSNGVIAGTVPSWTGEFSSARPFGLYKNQENYYEVRYEDIDWTNGLSYNRSKPTLPAVYGEILYVPFGTRDLRLYDFLYNNSIEYAEMKNNLMNTVKVNSVYCDGDMNIYACEYWR